MLGLDSREQSLISSRFRHEPLKIDPFVKIDHQLKVFMNFDKLEIYAQEAINAKHKNQGELEEKLEDDLTRMLTENELTFPIEETGLINNNTASFIYKNGKTYLHLMEFMARILHVEIPIEIDNCKFGPGEIVVSAKNSVEAREKLEDCSHKLQGLIQAKRGRKL